MKPIPTPTAADFDALIALFNSRRYVELEAQVRVLLNNHPRVPFAWQLLGGALQMQGKDAITAFQQVAELSPNDAGAQFNLGVAFKSAGQLEQAAVSYRHALALRTNYVEALSNLGNVLQDLGQLDEAVLCYRRALSIQPNAVDTHNNLGTVLKDLGQLDEAVVCYRQALRLKPDYADAHYNLGNVYKEMKQLELAVESYQQAVQIKPDFAEAHSNLGSVFQVQWRIDEAQLCYQRAAELKPDVARYHLKLGGVLYALKQIYMAIESYQRALTINPNYAEAHNQLGLCLKANGQLDNAIVSYRRAIECDSNLASAYCNLGDALRASAQYDGALDNYRHALLLQPDSAGIYDSLGILFSEIGQCNDAQNFLRRSLDIDPDNFKTHSNLLFSMCYDPTNGPADYLAESLQYGQNVAKKIISRFTTWQCNPQPQKLRVGIVSGDLVGHPVGYFLENLLMHLGTSRIELIAYSNNPVADDLTARIQPYFDQWHPVYARNDQATAQLIYDDGIHVLLDLSGHTGNNNLPVFAWKPAPVQATWLGYFASTGVVEMDYLLADETGVPESQRSHFSETIWYLPNTRLCFTPPNADLPATLLPSLNQPALTFGCYQNLAKVNNAVLAAWSRIFAALPQARLRLASKQLGDTAVVAQLKQRLEQHGITKTRVSMHGSVSRQDYMASYAEVDMLLDTFPYPGGTTTCEALWMGVPTLTLAGNTLLARQGASLLTAAGLPDWIARDEDDYVAKAIQFAGDLPKLAALRAGLREQVLASPLFNASRFAKHFEEALWGMWQAKQPALVGALQSPPSPSSSHQVHLA
ncbi:MAG: tetratricopeptide repeat protein [Gallionella sp.]